MTELLKFQKGNAKLKHHTFNLPAGHSCPYALECKQLADRDTGKLTRCKGQKFACYATAAEYMYPSARKARWYNFDLMKFSNLKHTIKLIQNSLPKKAKLIRLHSSGDFFNQRYFDAWLVVAQNNPDIIFYAYTKSLSYWVTRLEVIPSNFKLIASKGGKQDELIDKHGLRYAEVIFSLEQAKGRPIEHGNDELMYAYNGNFCLLIHGSQPAKSEASKALQRLRKAGIKTGYSK